MEALFAESKALELREGIAFGCATEECQTQILRSGRVEENELTISKYP